MHQSYSELRDELAASAQSLAILPVGCYEQHGPILPLGTDSLIAQAFSEALAERLRSHYAVHVFPPVHFTPTEPNRNFCGTIHISNDVARAYFREILTSLLHHPFHAVLIVNGHGSVDPVLKEVSFSAVYQQFASQRPRPVLCLNAFEFAADILKEFGQSPGRHAEWSEFLLTFHLLGRSYYTPQRLAQLEEFARSEGFHSAQPAVLGIPMELRSVDGVHGAPLPHGYPDIDLEAESRRLFEFLVEKLEAKSRRELDRFEEVLP